MVTIYTSTVKMAMNKITKTLLKKITKVASWTIGVWLILGTIIFIGYPWYQVHQAYINSDFHYKIEAIEFRTGNRGVPHVKMDTGWYLFRTNNELRIIPYVQVGDSVVKEKESSIIKVYRKVNGNFVVKEFD